MATQLMLDSIGLREVADYAASLRAPFGDQRYIIATYDPKAQDYKLSDAPDPPAPSTPDSAVVAVNTATVQPARVGMMEVTMNAVGIINGQVVELFADLADYDAVFWSEAAVEKFLFPYYASKYQWAAAEVLTLLSTVFYGYVPSMINGMSSAAAPVLTPAEISEIPFAMAHLPRSDYVPISESGVGMSGPPANFLMRDLVVLSHSQVTGTVVHRPLAEYAHLVHGR